MHDLDIGKIPVEFLTLFSLKLFFFDSKNDYIMESNENNSAVSSKCENEHWVVS